MYRLFMWLLPIIRRHGNRSVVASEQGRTTSLGRELDNWTTTPAKTLKREDNSFQHQHCPLHSETERKEKKGMIKSVTYHVVYTSPFPTYKKIYCSIFFVMTVLLTVLIPVYICFLFIFTKITPPLPLLNICF